MLNIKYLVDLASDVILLFIAHMLEGANGLTMRRLAAYQRE